jgi:hypothetical protein
MPRSSGRKTAGSREKRVLRHTSAFNLATFGSLPCLSHPRHRRLPALEPLARRQIGGGFQFSLHRRRRRLLLEPLARMEEGPAHRHRRLLLVRPGLQNGGDWRTEKCSAGSTGAARKRCHNMLLSTSGPTLASDRTSVMSRTVEPLSPLEVTSWNTSGPTPESDRTSAMFRSVENHSQNVRICGITRWPTTTTAPTSVRQRAAMPAS